MVIITSEGVRLGSLALLLGGAFALTAEASTTFSDGTFNLSDYTLATYSINQAITTSQITSGGNPGSAFQAVFAAGAGNSSGIVYGISSAFSYDPAVSGAISTLNFSQDGYITTTVGLGGFAERLLLLQSGNYYEYTVPLGTAEGVYTTASASGLTAASFAQITNLSDFTTNSANHPNFSSGAIQFGFVQGWHAVGGFPANSTVERLDNFQVSVTPASPVPEPASQALLGIGLGLIMLRFGWHWRSS